MKRLTTLLAVLVCGVGAALWLSQSFVNIWEPQLRAQLEARLSRVSHTRVQIASVSMPFFHRLRLSTVQVWTPDAHPQLILRADNITLTLSFIDLPRALWRRQPLESIGLIHVQSPWLQYSPNLVPTFSSSPKTASTLPLWFTLSWDGGTFQWKDPQAPTGTWTLYQAHGALKIRGPKINFAARGSTDQAQSIRADFSSLDRYWNARLTISNGNIDGILSSVAYRLQKTILPDGWTAKGFFNLDIVASGRHLPASADNVWTNLQHARLTFLRGSSITKPGWPAISVNGPIVADGLRVSLDNLKMSVGGQPIVFSGHAWPFSHDRSMALQATATSLNFASMSDAIGRPGLLSGEGSVRVTADGAWSDPVMSLGIILPTFGLDRLVTKDDALQASYRHHEWNIDDSHLHLADGVVSLKGHLSTDANDLTLTAENLSLAALSESPTPLVQGSLNAALSFRGPWNDGALSGSFWVTHFTWGTLDPTNVRGRLEWSDHHFQTSAASEDEQLQWSTEGSFANGVASIDHLSLHLPDGSTLAGAIVANRNAALSGTLDAEHIPLTGTLVPLQRWVPGLKGNAGGRAHISGTWSALVVKGLFQSDDLMAGADTLGHGQTSLEWSENHLTLPAFKLSSGIVGGWTWSGAKEWLVAISATQAPAGPLLKLVAPTSVLPGTLSGHVMITPRGMTWTSGRYEGPWAELEATGRAIWVMHGGISDRMDRALFTLDGKAHSPDRSRVTWHFPLAIKGHWSLGPDSQGSAEIEAKEVSVQGQTTDPFKGHVAWTRDTVSWKDATWGSHWASDGKILWDHAATTMSAALHFSKAPASFVASLTGSPQAKELEGLLDGTFTITGPLTALTEHLSLTLNGARWRRFPFHGTLSGDWNKHAQSSVQAAGSLDQGGQFTFQGAFDAKTNQILGGLKLTHFNLHPLGESLAFPQSLDGTAAGVLTVTGPLSSPRFAGKLQGGPITYAASTPHPIMIENYVTTLVVAPSPEDPKVTRLTLSDGLIKTKEEVIRIGAGSFVDYAPNQSSHLQIVTELRNVHLGVFTLFGGLNVDGYWQIKPKGFALTADASTRSLFINDYELEEGHINLDYQDNVLNFSPPSKGHALITGSVDLRQTPQIHFTKLSVAGKDGQGLQLNGDIGPSLWDFQMDGHGLDIGTLSGLASFPYPISGTARMSLKGTGDYQHPHLEGHVDLDDGNALGLGFKTGSAAFLWQNDRITFTQLSLAYPGRFKLLGNGGFPITPAGGAKSADPSVDFSVRLEDSNLGLLQSLSSEVKKAKGMVQGLLQITGTMDKPVLRGSLRITDGDVLGAHYIHHLKNLLASVDFNGDQLVIKELQGDAEAGGTFLASGDITLQGLVPSAYNLTAEVTSSDGLAVQVPELAIPESPLSAKLHFLTSTSQAVVKGHFAFTGPADAPNFKADALISRGHFTFPPSHKSPPPAAVMEWFRRINWDVHLKFGDGAWFDNELVEAAVQGKLDIRGDSDHLRVDGGLDINEGRISYLGLQFDLREARFDMRSDASGPTIVNTPYMRGVADSTVQAVDTLNGATPDPTNRQSVNDTITLNIDYAPIDEIKPRLTSAANPNLSNEKVLERVTQMDVEDLTPQERNLVYQQQMVQIIDSSIAQPFAKNILKRTGLVDNVRVQRVLDASSAQSVDPATGQITSNPQSSTSLFANTKYTFEKDLSNRVSLGYGIRFVPTTTATASAVNATDPQNKLDLVSDVQLSYRWFKNVYVRGDVDLPNSDPNIIPDRRVTIEPRWRFGWWGNTNKDKIKPAPLPSSADNDRGQ